MGRMLLLYDLIIPVIIQTLINFREIRRNCLKVLIRVELAIWWRADRYFTRQ